MKKFVYILIAISLSGLFSCQSEPKKPETKTAASQGEADKSLNRFQELVNSSKDVEFIFYNTQGSMTTSIQDFNEIQSFKNFVIAKAVAPDKATCTQDGGIVFRDGAGKIIIELDYSLKPSCPYARVRMDGTYSYLTISEYGEAFLAKFFKMFTPEGMQQMQEQATPEAH